MSNGKTNKNRRRKPKKTEYVGLMRMEIENVQDFTAEP